MNMVISNELSNPSVIIISGPNGAGKSTAAPHLLKGALAVAKFVNADVIARGLSAFEPERVAMAAGRIMLPALTNSPRSGRRLLLKLRWLANHLLPGLQS